MHVATIELKKRIGLAMDGLWYEGKRTTSVVTKIELEAYSVEDAEDEDELGWVSVYVTHDNIWTVYTDNGFSEAVTELVKKATGVDCELDFTEQGEQEDGLAFMENVGSDRKGRALGDWIRANGKMQDDNAHITKLQAFLRGAVGEEE